MRKKLHSVMKILAAKFHPVDMTLLFARVSVSVIILITFIQAARIHQSLRRKTPRSSGRTPIQAEPRSFAKIGLYQTKSTIAPTVRI